MRMPPVRQNFLNGGSIADSRREKVNTVLTSGKSSKICNTTPAKDLNREYYTHDSNLLQLLPPFFWRHVEHRVEGARERRVVAEAAGVADVCDGVGASEHLPRGEQTFACDVLVDAVARFLLEFPHEIVFAEIHFAGECGDREVFAQMLVDVCEDGLDFFIIRRGMKLAELMRKHGAVQEDHEFDEEDFRVETVREAFGARRALEFFHMEQQVVGEPRACMHDGRPRSRFRKARGEVVFVSLAAREKFGCDVDDDALVRRGTQDRPMDLAGRDENDVAHRERIAAPFDDVVSVAAEEQDDLVEVMVVKGNGLQPFVFQAEHAEIAQQVAFLFVRLQIARLQQKRSRCLCSL